MPRHVLLLRGVNVGGRNKLPMDELRGVVERLGATEVSTYIQSGNVLFSAAKTKAKALPAGLREAIGERYGYDVPVMLRDAGALGRIVDGNPFSDAPPKSVHVAFLEPSPTADCVAALDPERSPPDRFAPGDGVLYLCYPNGMARTKLTNAYLDRTLGVASTLRNWNTVGRLLDLVS
jgi:uncharacterized protein (DUF1697 family)